MTLLFDHEKLTVYQRTIEFNAWVGELLDRVTKKAAVKDQIDRAATSIALNIAEGNGKFSHRERAHYFDIARGSAVECAACLDIFLSRKLIAYSEIGEGKNHLVNIVNMLMALIGRFSDSTHVKDELFDATLSEEPATPFPGFYPAQSKRKK